MPKACSRMRFQLIISASSFRRRIWTSGAPCLAAGRATSWSFLARVMVAGSRFPRALLVLAMVDRDG
eukprot:12666854-Alexandrium_andersonii.AAC.1